MNLLAMILQRSPDTTAVQNMLIMMIPIILVIVIVCLAIILVPFWFICKKAGFSPWLSLLNIVPMGNLVLIYILAFAEWKVIPAPQYPAYAPPVPPPYPPAPPAA